MENNRSTFAEDCKIVNFKYEYPGYIDEVKFGIITALSEGELEQHYSKQLDEYRPYIVLSPAFGEIRAEFVKNEKKHAMRQLRSESIFGFDENTERLHHEIVIQDFLSELISIEEKSTRDSKLQEGLMLLSETQRRRIIQHFCYGMSERDIASKEGKEKSTVHESILAAMKKMRKFYLIPPQNASLSGNK